MTQSDPKADLQRYLQAARETLLWKLEGLDAYDARRPLTPTGTNLLGLVKHAAGVEVAHPAIELEDVLARLVGGGPHIRVGLRVVLQPGQHLVAGALEAVPEVPRSMGWHSMQPGPCRGGRLSTM